jgi:choline dehydrogenase-like flavoprotein
MPDYVIVGAGSAGCVIAARLAELPDAKVLLLEAGPLDTDRLIHLPVGFFKMTDGPLTWGFKTAPLAHADNREMVFPQGRVLGGGSSINAMVYTRGNAADYDSWAADEGCSGWAYADVLPYFRKAEDNERFSNAWHGTGGPLGVSDLRSPHPLTKAFVRAAQEAGLAYNPDFNGREQAGAGLYQVTQRGGRRCSAAVGYLKRALERPNLRLVTDVRVERLLIENGRATGVAYSRFGQHYTASADVEVIVTAGAVGSPRLLLLSGIGPADELRALGITVAHDLPGVGRNFHDHIDVYVISELAGPHSYDKHTRPHKMLWAGLEFMLLKSGPVTSNLAEGGAFVTTDPAEPSPDIQHHFLPGAGLEAGVPPVPSGYGCTLNSCYLRPKSRGTIRLRSADPAVAPVIDPNYWAEPSDMAASLRGLASAREIMAQPAFRPFVAREHLPGKDVTGRAELEAYARRLGKTDYHPVGSCKMGTDDLAVVDPECRVRGIERLRICDSSIMPRVVSSNTNAASIMIGEKAADLVKGNRRAGEDAA